MILGAQLFSIPTSSCILDVCCHDELAASRLRSTVFLLCDVQEIFRDVIDRMLPGPKGGQTLGTEPHSRIQRRQRAAGRVFQSGSIGILERVARTHFFCQASVSLEFQ